MGNSNKQKGHTAEFFACYQISQEGFKPFLIPHGQAFDIFATNDRTGELIRVQVKSTSQYSTSPARNGDKRQIVIPRGFIWNLQIGISKTDHYDFKALEIFALINLEQEMIAFVTANELAAHPSKVTIKVRDMAKYTFKRAMNLLHNI
jgi:hypothetical protein